MTKTNRSNRPTPTKGDLSPGRTRLVELMQEINFGRIEGLRIVDGEPEATPTRIVREVKFGGENGTRPERDVPDFALKAQVVELLRSLDAIGDGTVDLIEIKHGLPFRMLVADSAA